MSARKLGERVAPTHEWDSLLPLFDWPEQERYEEIRPLVLFDVSVAERAREVGISTATLYRRLNRFEEVGVESLFDAEKAKRRRLPPSIVSMILSLKGEYPAFNTNEIANIIYILFGRRLDVRTVKAVLDENPIPIKFIRLYPPYHEIEKARERRLALVTLHAYG